jgi:hypothetical protein
MQGVELIDRLLLGTPEKTTGFVYSVSEDGRAHASHERPLPAGSGEPPRRRVEIPEVVVRQADATAMPTPTR